MLNEPLFTEAPQSIRLFVSGGDPDAPSVFSEVIEKHMPGRHDQQRHAGERGGEKSFAESVGLRPDKARQQRFRDIMDASKSAYEANTAIRQEIEALPDGKQVLHAIDKWYYNPGDPDKAMQDQSVIDDYMGMVDEFDEFGFEEYVNNVAEDLDWDPSGDTQLSDMMEAVMDGSASPEQVDAMSAIYDYTQVYNRRSGSSRYDLSRGLALDEYDVAQLEVGNEIRLSPLSHWSENKQTPAKFAAAGHGESDGELKEVILHKKFESEEIFNNHHAKADKNMNVAYQLDYEEEYVPISSGTHKIVHVTKKTSDWTGDGVVHVWLQ